MVELLSLIYWLFSSLIGIAVVTLPIIVVVLLLRNARKKYENTEYFFITKKSYYDVILRDSGSYGEYSLYKHLATLPGNKRFLFNCYIPKNDGTTSEIDVILLHMSGIYVFESKNYSGWIFGTESQKMWTQRFRNGHTERFYNPLMQNNGHIKWLKSFLPEVDEGVYHSIIVFSERCSLKQINLTTATHKVVNRYDVYPLVAAMANQRVLSDESIERIFQKLYPLTQSSEEIRTSHINTIQSYNNTHTKAIPPLTVASSNQPLEVQRKIEVTGSFEQRKLCSRCGAEMVVRIASRGERKGKKFWGCSNYPKCRNIVNID
jgi:hypothetical protein